MKKENRIHDIFIAYSKLPLETNPEKLFEIFEIAQKHIVIDAEFLQTTDGVIKYFGHMASKSDFENIEECQQRHNIYRGITLGDPPKMMWTDLNDQEREDNRLYELAYKSTYPPKYLYGFFEGEFGVPPEEIDLTKLHKVISKDIELPKLYVEVQSSFNKLLEEIISGKQFSKITFPNLTGRFSNITIDSYSLIQSKIKVDPDGKSGAEDLKKQTIWGTDATRLLTNGECEFNDLVLNLVGYSLIEFLLSPDRRKLKRCHRCNEFYIQSKLNPRQKYCSKCSRKSKMSKEKRNEYMKEYNRKKKQERLNKEREERIENLLKRTGFSRKEVEDIIEADSKL